MKASAAVQAPASASAHRMIFNSAPWGIENQFGWILFPYFALQENEAKNYAKVKYPINKEHDDMSDVVITRVRYRDSGCNAWEA